MTDLSPDPRYALTFTPVVEPVVEPEPTAAPGPPLHLLYVPPLYTYAYGPGYFLRHESPEEFDAGVTAGLWGPRETVLEVTEEVKDAIQELCLRGHPKADGGEHPPVGGARVGRGYLYLDEFDGKTPADQMRDALARTNQAIVPLPGTTLDLGSQPLDMTARKTIMGLGGPQNEFKSTWPLYIKGSVAAIRNAANGTNYNGNKGWVLKDLCIVGQSGIPMIEPVVAGNQLNYVGFDGCSIDTWKFVLDGPALGMWIGAGIYTNNIYGDFAYRFKGSDQQLFTDGGKLDFGKSQRNPNATALIFSWMEKSHIGPLYVTGDPARCMLIEGSYEREGLTFLGLTLEGRNAGAQSAGAVLRITGGGGTFLGCDFNYSKAGRGEQGIVMVSGGSASFLGCRWRRAGGYGPEIYQSGGVVDVSGARLVDPEQPPRQIDYQRAGGTLLSADNTVRLI